MPIRAYRVRHIVMIQLTDPRREVTMESKCLRQTNMSRNRLPEKLPVCQNARAVWVKPRQH